MSSIFNRTTKGLTLATVPRHVQPQLVEGDKTGLVYATSDAANYNESISGQTFLSGGSYCGEDVNTVTTTVLSTGVENIVSGNMDACGYPKGPYHE